jgi:hypothetical protein
MKIVTRLVVLACTFAPSLATADDLHPALQSKFHFDVGGFFSARTFQASAAAEIPGVAQPLTIVETAVGVKDAPELLIAGFGWRFAENWQVGLQYFNSSRSTRVILEDTVEWKDLTFDAGVDVSARTKLAITRLVFSRDIWESGPHSLKLAGGLHILDTGAEVSGMATLDDQSREFRRSAVSASLPIPNVGVWYRYAPSRRWLFGARVDWLSANVGDYSGLIWNAVFNAGYALNDHFGVGLGYQYFRVDGEIRAPDWNGKLRSRFDGPILHLTAYW